MSRYIDAEWLLNRYREVQFRDGMTEGVVRFLVEANIKNAPSIDIVRCAECKHYAEHNELYINEPTTCVKHSVIGHYVVVNADDFCSYGERREP